MIPSSNKNVVSPNTVSPRAACQTVADQTEVLSGETTTSVTDENKGDSMQSEQGAKKPIQTLSEKTDEPVEFGGRDGLDPTRYGDWEKNGRCIDF